MPTVSEMLVSSTLEQAQKGPDVTGAVTKGAQLAESIQNMAAQREQIEAKKQEIKMQKAVAVTDTLKIAAQSKDRNLKNFLLKKVLPSKVKALGMEEFFTPETMEMLQTSDAVQAKVLGLQLDLNNKVQNKEITGAEAYSIARRVLSDPEELALLDTDSLFESQKFANSEQGKLGRAQLVQQAQNIRQEKQIGSAGRVEAAKATAQEYADFQSKGGRATIEKNLSKLENAAKILESGQLKTGKISAALPLLKSDEAQDILNPEIARIRDDVRGAIQASLKQTLGSQFTAQEGEAIFSRAFNPRLSAEENARRIRIEIKGLQDTLKNKEMEFASEGFQVKPSGKEKKLDLSALKKKKADFDKLPPSEQGKALKGLAKKLDISIDKLKTIFGVE